MECSQPYVLDAFTTDQVTFMETGLLAVDERSQIEIRVDAARRLFLINTLSGRLPIYVVTEYPRSGGTWIGQMISGYLNLPFPRNRRAVAESCVLHGHYLPTPMMRNVTCLIRDGRDAAVSFYYKALFYTNVGSQLIVKRFRRQNRFRDYEDIYSNLPSFIEFLFERERRRPFHFNWKEFADAWWDRPGRSLVLYEDVIADPVCEMRRVLQELTGGPVDAERLQRVVEEFSFEKQTGGRPRGQEHTVSFLRKGIVGDWVHKFSPQACEVFDYYAGDTLIKVGFELDHSWAKKKEQ